MFDGIAIPKTIYDYCEARDRAIMLFTQGSKILKDAESLLKGLGDYGLSPYDAHPKIDIEKYKKELDQRFWRMAFSKTGLLQVMDMEAKKDFDKDLESNPPEFTIENIKSTFFSVASDADRLFARGLVNVFLSLSGRHKTNTNSPFKVNSRIVMSYMVESNWSGGLRIGGYYSHASEKINDIDRVIKVLDGKKHQAQELEYAVNASLMKNEAYEDEYYIIKGFKNRNMHLQFKRQDLLDKANRIIADYYNGNALAA